MASEGEVEEEGPAGEDGKGVEVDGEDMGEGEGALDGDAEDAGESFCRGGMSLAARSSGLEPNSELGVGEAIMAVEATSSSTDGVTSAKEGEQ